MAAHDPPRRSHDVPPKGVRVAPRAQRGSHDTDTDVDQRDGKARRRTPYGPQADTRAHPHGLTRRERVVLELLAAGNRDADIAAALGISPKTASNHVGTILVKLGVHNRTQAAAYAQKPSKQKELGVSHPDAPTVSPE